jgi:PIN domain nuclease of toxin-antitoxin system
MNILLDTCVFLWIIADKREKLSSRAVEVYKNTENDIYLSAVSSWEIVIKTNTGKLTLTESPAQRLPTEIKRTGCQPLPIYHSHALELSNLPHLHSDPFDRMLVCQAKCEDLVLLTPDTAIHEYAIKTLW